MTTEAHAAGSARAWTGCAVRGGTGLAELEARVQGQGGTLSSGPDDAGGWLVVCTMPAARVPHAGEADVPD